jgi:hypothetical protein
MDVIFKAYDHNWIDSLFRKYCKFNFSYMGDSSPSCCSLRYFIGYLAKHLHMFPTIGDKATNI